MASRQGDSKVSNPIARRLRELRAHFGFARRSDMANHLGLPNSTYSAYEGDSGPPKVEWLVELARRGINLNWLLTGDGSMLMAPAGPTGLAGSRSHAQLDGHSNRREPDVDTYLLAAMIRRVERQEQESGRVLTALEKGEMICRLYLASTRLTESELATAPAARANGSDPG